VTGAQPRPGRLLAAASALLALGALAACSSPSAAATGPAPRLYTAPGNPLLPAAALLRANGKPREAADLTRIADTPSGIWAAGQPGEMREVRRVTQAAARQGEMPVIVAYNLPDRDACGRFSAATGPSPAGYRRWIRQLAAAIGTSPAIVVVEPDGLPDIVRDCLTPQVGAQRYALLRYAMQRLGALRRARVYLDAGNPGIFADPSPLAAPLEQAGLRYGRGFSANVSNFQATPVVVAWSQALERKLGGRVTAIIDTSRNGNGPYTGPLQPQWCNPPGRALGLTPRLDPGPAGIDAYLWVKDPGASDGPCNGGPAAGQYWPEYALGLARHGADA
jgi:endoglucanase